LGHERGFRGLNREGPSWAKPGSADPARRTAGMRSSFQPGTRAAVHPGPGRSSARGDKRASAARYSIPISIPIGTGELAITARARSCPAADADKTDRPVPSPGAPTRGPRARSNGDGARPQRPGRRAGSRSGSAELAAPRWRS